MKPIQPIKDNRFVGNEIVRYLLDNGGIDLNKLAVLDFSQEDREQFAQLIGYSLSGYSELSYVSDETYEAVEEKMMNLEITDIEARYKVVKGKLDFVRKGIKEIIPHIYQIHPDDFRE